MPRLYERELLELDRLSENLKRPSDVLARYQRFLKLEEHRIFLQHRQGEDGLTTAHHRAALINALLRHLWRKAEESFQDKKKPLLTLIAVGGFGRYQLCPHSDIDLLFLQSNASELSRPWIEYILYQLWDLGLKPGYAVRTMEEVISLANEDLQTKTSLLETRYIIGDEALWQRFNTDFPRHCIIGKEKEFLLWRIEDQTRRHTEQGRSVFLQEPNIKQSCGGLRDYHHLLWIGRVVLGIQSTQDFVESRYLTPTERKQLEKAYNFLLRIRHEMHYLQKRPGDILTLPLQGKIANSLRYQHKTLLRRIEALMRDYYHHANIIYQTSRWLTDTLHARFYQQEQKKLWNILPLKKNTPRAIVIDGFTLKPDGISMARPTLLSQDPRLLVRVFLILQQRQLPLSPELASEIRRRAYLLKRSLIYENSIVDMLLHILSQKGQVGRALRSMHELGILGRLFPEFAPLTCLVQHEFYHRYTADEHTLQAIETLDALVASEIKALEPYQQLIHRIERPHLLYLAMLLHDTGKAQNTRDHAGASAVCAMRAARRLRLPPQELSTLVFLVDHHTTLSEWARRRNIDDETVILEFARIVKTQERLDLLMLLTYADIQATGGDVAWSRWSQSLHWMLYRRASQALASESEFIEALHMQLQSTREECLNALKDRIPAEEINRHFELMPIRYAIGRPSDIIQSHILAVHEFLIQQHDPSSDPLAPIISWTDYPDEDHSIIIVVTWNRERVFAKITAALTAVGLSIVHADIQTRQDDIVIDTFTVMTRQQKAATDPRDKKKFKELLHRSLCVSGNSIEPQIPAPKTVSFPVDEIPPRIFFSNDMDPRYTVLEIRATDRPALLYQITNALADCKIDVGIARITTEKGVALDTFYIRRKDGHKLDPTKDIPPLSQLLRERLAIGSQSNLLSASA
ncbi:MAG: [protein-PII] uridylyltransferase [Methylacidiphilales bacterium]|nr:[protein-PII] uridylyltransferase [Candidatus Methylacidiphilales bacterium]MDW8348930.1 [protein-PII] uridylyltransferase [Verrucomicrobiae bacterium]